MNTQIFNMFYFFSLLLIISLYSCRSTGQGQEPVFEEINKNTNAKGQLLKINVVEGPEHNHPLMAFWLEEEDGSFIQTLFVARSIGKGVFEHGKADQGQWKPGEIQRPSALPVWSHKQQEKKNKYGNYLPTPDNPVPDTYTGATPKHSFKLKVRSNEPIEKPVKIMMEINQAFDWNEYWTNGKYPEEEEYKNSAQPAVVYQSTLNPEYTDSTYTLEPVGHAHYAGKNGKIYKDLSTITTAQKIVRKVTVTIKEN
ncbi:MAG: hypothetical protein ACOCPM_02035 [Bacteroidales bacterium]